MNVPLVSIIIPVYNGSNYMREAIESAIAQTYENTEIIVVNDGSDDDGATERIALSYGDKIRYFYKSNGGVSSALNYGIQRMNGAYFSWLSHDDVYESDKVEKQVEALSKVDGNTIISCESIQIDEHSNVIAKRIKRKTFQPELVYDWKEALKGLLEGGSLHGCCLLIPREILFQCGLFDETLRFCQDAFMWYKVFLAGCSLYCCNDSLVRGRIHQKQLTQTGQSIFHRDCAAISLYLAEVFASVSDEKYNFLRMYLLCDAKHLPFKRVNTIIEIGKKQKLISKRISVKAYNLCLYGKVRPYLRKLYYYFFRKIKTV